MANAAVNSYVPIPERPNTRLPAGTRRWQHSLLNLRSSGPLDARARFRCLPRSTAGNAGRLLAFTANLESALIGRNAERLVFARREGTVESICDGEADPEP